MLLLFVHTAILQPQLSRRAVLTTTAAAAAGQALGGGSLPVYAAGDERAALLAAIANGDDAAVVSALASLLPLDPSKQRAAAAPQLDGRWRLLWSQGAEKFSPLLGLPKPVRPESFQLIGDAAAAEFGAGRIANVLDLGVGRILLSSGARPAADDAATLEIFPPFRLELAAGPARKMLVEAGSDADFRAVNARTAEAQAAPKNRYAQQYLDVSGQPGDLRVSEVVSGDPVIVGCKFVHVRL